MYFRRREMKKHINLRLGGNKWEEETESKGRNRERLGRGERWHLIVVILTWEGSELDGLLV